MKLPKATFVRKTWLLHNTSLCFFDCFKVWNDDKTRHFDEKMNLPKATFVPKTCLLHNTPLCFFFWAFQSLKWCENSGFWWKWSFQKRLLFLKLACYTTPSVLFWLFQSLKRWENPTLWWKVNLPKATFVSKTCLLHNTSLCFFWPFKVWNDAKIRHFDEKWTFRKRPFVTVHDTSLLVRTQGWDSGLELKVELGIRDGV